MIFLNRRRTPLKQEATKDPSKYWYVEKYVYGVLKDTVEIPLGTGIKFTGIESGYDDDWFEGWSKSSTSTARTFNITTTYKNTTTTIKNLLDSDNTIKLYGVYRYSKITTKAKSDDVSPPATANGLPNSAYAFLIAKEAGTIIVSGYVTREQAYMSNGVTGSYTTTYQDVSILIKDKDGNEKGNITATHGNNGKGQVDIGDKISYSISATLSVPTSGNPPSGDVTKTSSTISISSTGYMYNLMASPKFRVISHT